MEGYKSQVLFQVENKISHSLCKIYEYFREKKGWKKSDSTRVLNLSILVQYFVVCNPLTPTCVFVVHVYACVCVSLSFFRFMAYLEQFESQIPDAQCVKHIFSLTETFYLTKTEKRAKKSQTQLSHYWF